jgi:hypothetical protein
MYDDIIPAMVTLNRMLQGPLKHHCSADLLSKCSRLLESLRHDKEKHDEWINWDAVRQKNEIKEISLKMDKLLKKDVWPLPKCVNDYLSKRSKAYDAHRTRLVKLLKKRFDEAQSALTNKDVGELRFIGDKCIM